jgi:hypothetical protein
MGGLRKAKCWMVGVALTATVVVLPATARAEEMAKEAGIGFGTAVLNLLYIPVKITYAALGGVTGGLAYALTGGSLDTARQVWEPSMGGTYVLTPEMLRGQETVRFSGSSAPSEPSTTQLSESPTQG